MSKYLLVGEAYGAEEERVGKPFVGKSGQLLTWMLQAAGIDREKECAITNVVNKRPPENKLESRTHAWWTAAKSKAIKYGCPHFSAGYYFNDLVLDGLVDLMRVIAREKPECIIAFGEFPMWALTGLDRIGAWRGSELWLNESGDAPMIYGDARIPVIPTYHPAFVLRKWEWKAIVQHDLRRRVVGKLGTDRQPPAYDFVFSPTFETAMHFLNSLRHAAIRGDMLTCDVETRKGRIACVGFGMSPTRAICVPFMHVDGRRIWTPDQELELVAGCRAILTQPEGFIVGQNFNYDSQYFAADPAFGFVPDCKMDTMIAQALLYPGTEKSLAHMSSMYCKYHRYWKDEGKEIEGEQDEERWWYYNCLDDAITFEVATTQRRLLEKAGFA